MGKVYWKVKAYMSHTINVDKELILFEHQTRKCILHKVQ